MKWWSYFLSNKKLCSPTACYHMNIHTLLSKMVEINTERKVISLFYEIIVIFLTEHWPKRPTLPGLIQSCSTQLHHHFLFPNILFQYTPPSSMFPPTPPSSLVNSKLVSGIIITNIVLIHCKCVNWYFLGWVQLFLLFLKATLQLYITPWNVLFNAVKNKWLHVLNVALQFSASLL